ncbi:branched-chain amino acid ABC transporter substrate-binding protein, partial [Rhizobium ruizarguesonis]
GIRRGVVFGKEAFARNAGPRVSTLGAMGYALDQLKAKSVVCIGPNIPNVGTWSCEGIKSLAKEKGFTAETILMDPGT